MRHAAAVLLALCLAAYAGAVYGPEDPEAVFAFWDELFQGPVTPEHWAESPDDPPEVAEAKETLRQGLGPLLAECEWKPARDMLRLRPLDGGESDHISAAIYVDGDVAYAGFVAREGAAPFRAFFPERRHMFDVFYNRYAGHDVGRGIQLAPGEAYFMAMYPHQVFGMSLALEPETARPGGTVRARIALQGSKTPGLHCFRLRVVGPQGEEHDDLFRLVMAEKGEAEAEIVLPEDLPPGRYSVSARCAVTAAIDGQALHVER